MRGRQEYPAANFIAGLNCRPGVRKRLVQPNANRRPDQRAHLFLLPRVSKLRRRRDKGLTHPSRVRFAEIITARRYARLNFGILSNVERNCNSGITHYSLISDAAIGPVRGFLGALPVRTAACLNNRRPSVYRQVLQRPPEGR
jgi:hypothetical protein